MGEAKIQHESWPLSAKLLRFLSRSPDSSDYAGGTERHVDNLALEFVLKTVPSFPEMIRCRSILDYGCGRGDQVLAMKKAGAERVVGYDPFPKFPRCYPTGVEFTAMLPSERFDVVLSSSSFEHFADPEREFGRMKRLTDGVLVITWAEPWYSHSGSHMNYFTRLPWVNLIFPERSVMLVRSIYLDDGAQYYEECGDGGGLNRMTVARFETIIRRSGMNVLFYRNYATMNLPLVTQIPFFRELLTSACACVMSACGQASSRGELGRWPR